MDDVAFYEGSGFGDEPEEGAVDKGDKEKYEWDGPDHMVMKKTECDPPEPEQGKKSTGKEPCACIGRQQKVKKEQAKQGVEPRQYNTDVGKVKKGRSCQCDSDTTEKISFWGRGAA